MNKIILILFLFISWQSFAQNDPGHGHGGPSITIDEDVYVAEFVEVINDQYEKCPSIKLPQSPFFYSVAGFYQAALILDARTNNPLNPPNSICVECKTTEQCLYSQVVRDHLLTILNSSKSEKYLCDSKQFCGEDFHKMKKFFETKFKTIESD